MLIDSVSRGFGPGLVHGLSPLDDVSGLSRGDLTSWGMESFRGFSVRCLDSGVGGLKTGLRQHC